VLVSALPQFSQDSKAQPGVWTDDFADETKVFSKSNSEVFAGFARIQTLATDYDWKKEGVVVDIGGLPDPDSKSAYEPWVLKGSDGLYRMWYGSVTTADYYQIMHATSWDGYTWEKHGVAIYPGFSGTAKDAEKVYSPCVIEEGEQYRMYYSGADSSDYRYTLMATSTDGQTWNYAGLALDRGGPGEVISSAFASVLYDAGTFKAWYSGYESSQQIFHATSPNGISWTKQGLVLGLGPPGAPDDDEIVKNVVVKNSTGTSAGPFQAWPRNCAPAAGDSRRPSDT